MERTVDEAPFRARVRYAECNAHGELPLATYVNYFGEAAAQALRRVGLDLQALTARGGVLREGAVADLVMFDPDEVASEDAVLVEDLPGGCRRLTAASRGVRRVLINGVAVVADGVATGATPGVVLRSGVDTETVSAR